jgi:hypothetical protein
VSLHFFLKKKKKEKAYFKILGDLRRAVYFFHRFGFWQQVPDFQKMEIKRKAKNFSQLTSADSWDYDAAPCAPEVISRTGSCSSGRCCAYENSTDIFPLNNTLPTRARDADTNGNIQQ